MLSIRQAIWGMNPYAKDESTYNTLFDETILKKMKPFLKITAEIIIIILSLYSLNYKL